MGLSCSSCYCAYSWDNMKCNLMNAAQRRQAKRPCRCLTRRPKCLRIRRKRNFKCKCTHQDCALGLAKPPIPLGCGPPMKSPCKSPSPARSGIPRSVSLRTNPPCLKSPKFLPPCLRFPSVSQKLSSNKLPGKCSREVNTDTLGILAPCSRPVSPTLCLCKKTPSPCPARKREVCTNTSGMLTPRSRPASPTICLCPKTPNTPEVCKYNCGPNRVSKTVNTETLCPVRRSRSPNKSSEPATRSQSQSPDSDPVYVSCGGEGMSSDRKNVCRFTVDAYFT